MYFFIFIWKIKHFQPQLEYEWIPWHSLSSTWTAFMATNDICHYFYSDKVVADNIEYRQITLSYLFLIIQTYQSKIVICILRYLFLRIQISQSTIVICIRRKHNTIVISFACVYAFWENRIQINIFEMKIHFWCFHLIKRVTATLPF